MDLHTELYVAPSTLNGRQNKGNAAASAIAGCADEGRWPTDGLAK